MWNYPQLDTDVDRPLVENPDAPSDLFAAVLNGAYAGTKPGTERFVDAEWSNNNGVLTGYTNPATEGWAYSSELGRWVLSGKSVNATAVVPHSNSLDLQTCSISCWVKRTGTFLNNDQIIGRPVSSAPVDVPYRLYLRDGHLAYGWFDNTSKIAVDTGGISITTNQWFHYAGISFPTGGAWVPQIYRDGNLIDTGDSGTPPIRTSSLFLLGEDGRRYFNGQTADNLIYPFALDPDLIEWLADRTNRLYIPDTRQYFYAPLVTGWRPWLRTRQRHRLGA
jgi:hypothetical protein